MNSLSRSRVRKLVLVAVLGDPDPLDQFHDKVGPAVVRRPCVEDSGDVGMVHHRQSLALGLEPGDDLAAVHARLDDLQRDAAPDRLPLFGHRNFAHPAHPDSLQQLVTAD